MEDECPEPCLFQMLLKHVEDEADKERLLVLDSIPNPNEFPFDLEMGSLISDCFSNGQLKHPKALGHMLEYIAH